MGDIACIGSRNLSEQQTQTCEKLGAWIVSQGHQLHSGNALGADQAYARGANQVNPEKVTLHLPWSSYERMSIVRGNVVRCLEELPAAERDWYLENAKLYHPAWERLKQGGQKLMARNGMIVLPQNRKPVDLIIALPSDRPGGGGTGQGMRQGRSLGIEVIDISHASKHELWELCERIRGMT